MTYKIYATYPNGRTSVETSHRFKSEAVAQLTEMANDKDLKLTAKTIHLHHNLRELAVIPVELFNMDALKLISWPHRGNKHRLINPRKLSVVIPEVIALELEKIGKGNLSRGLQTLFLMAKPELTEKDIYLP